METNCGFQVEDEWLPERGSLIRIALNGCQERCIVSRGRGWRPMLLLAHKILAADHDETLASVLALHLYLDGRTHGGQVSLPRIASTVLTLLSGAKLPPSEALAGVTSGSRSRFADRNAPWQVPLLRGLAPYVAVASVPDQLPWVNLPVWMDVAEIVVAYRDSSELAAKRDMIIQQIPKSGFLRGRASSPGPDVIESLADEFPNFTQVIEHIANQLAIEALGNGQLRLPPILLLGAPGSARQCVRRHVPDRQHVARDARGHPGRHLGPLGHRCAGRDIQRTPARQGVEPGLPSGRGRQGRGNG